MFEVRNIGKTLINRSQGLSKCSGPGERRWHGWLTGWHRRNIENAVDGLRHRVFEVSMADLQKNEEHSFRKVRLRVEETQGRNCLTNFWGMDMTSDKLRSLVKKWQSLIEAHVDVKTQDGYVLRIFAIAFTKRHRSQIKKTTYAQSAQIREIRKKMFEIISREATGCEMKDLVQKL